MTGPLLTAPRRASRGGVYTVSILARSRVVLAVAYGSTPERAKSRAEKIRKALWDEVVVGEREEAQTT